MRRQIDVYTSTIWDESELITKNFSLQYIWVEKWLITKLGENTSITNQLKFSAQIC